MYTVFLSIAIRFLSELQPTLLWCSDITSRHDVIAQGLQYGALVGSGVGQFDDGLKYLIEEGVALETAGVQVVVNFYLVASAPEAH